MAGALETQGASDLLNGHVSFATYNSRAVDLQPDVVLMRRHAGMLFEEAAEMVLVEMQRGGQARH